MASKHILRNLRERDLKAGRGYINDLGEYVSYEEEERAKGWEEPSEDSIYMPPSMKKRQAEQAAVKKSIREAATAGSEKLRARLKDSTPEEKLYPDIYHARKKREARSKYFPQTGTRSDEEKGFFRGFPQGDIYSWYKGNVFPDDMTANKIREDHKICLFNNSGYGEGEYDEEIKDLW